MTSSETWTPSDEFTESGTPKGTTGGLDTSPESDDTDEPGASPSTGIGTCDNGLEACGTSACEVDVRIDPMHCGTCGHDCLGGECLNGRCQPTTIHIQGDIRDIAADENDVYFSTGATVERIPQELAPLPVVMYDDGEKEKGEHTHNRFIVLAGDSVVLAGGLFAEAYVHRIPKNGGGIQDLYFSPQDTGQIQHLGATSGRVFWVTRSPDFPAAYNLFGATIDGAVNLAYLSDSADASWPIAANDAFIFFAIQGEETTIRRRAVGGQAAVDVSTGYQSCGLGMVASAERLFFVCAETDSSHALYSSDLDGRNRELLLSAGDSVFSEGRSLIHSDGNLAWWDIEDGIRYLRAVDDDGGDSVTLYQTAVVVVNDRLVYDSEAYFFAEDVSVRMLAR